MSMYPVEKFADLEDVELTDIENGQLQHWNEELEKFVNGSVIYVDQSNGRLGVGVAAPLYALDVAGATTPTIRVKTLTSGSSKLSLYNSNNGNNLAASTIVGQLVFGGHYGGLTDNNNEICSVIGVYAGDGTTRSGILRLRVVNAGSTVNAV